MCQNKGRDTACTMWMNVKKSFQCGHTFSFISLYLYIYKPWDNTVEPSSIFLFLAEKFLLIFLVFLLPILKLHL